MKYKRFVSGLCGLLVCALTIGCAVNTVYASSGGTLGGKQIRTHITHHKNKVSKGKWSKPKKEHVVKVKMGKFVGVKGLSVKSVKTGFKSVKVNKVKVYVPKAAKISGMVKAPVIKLIGVPKMIKVTKVKVPVWKFKELKGEKVVSGKAVKAKVKVVKFTEAKVKMGKLKGTKKDKK